MCVRLLAADCWLLAAGWQLLTAGCVGYAGCWRLWPQGTEYMHSVGNVLIYGGLKACWHSNNQRYENNLIVRPDLGRLGPQACSGCIAGAPDRLSYQQTSTGGHWPKNESKHGDVCVTETGEMYGFSGACDTADLNGTALYATNSTYYSSVAPTVACNTKGGAVSFNLSEWNALWASAGLGSGGEGGSVHIPTAPTTAAIADMARERLGLKSKP